MRRRLRTPFVLLMALVAAPSLAGCIDVPDEALGAAAAGIDAREVELLRTQVRLDAVSGMEQTVDVEVPEGAQRVDVRVTIDGVVNRLTWSGPGERCAGHAGLYASRGTATTGSTCEAPGAGTHPLTFRLRDGAATLDVVVTAALPAR